MAVSAPSLTTRIAGAVQSVIDAATRVFEQAVSTPQQQLVPVRVKVQGRDGRSR